MDAICDGTSGAVVINEAFCHEEMAAARAGSIRVIGCQEEGERRNRPDRALEKSRARTGGQNGGPVHEAHVEQNLLFLDNVCFIPYRTSLHEVQPMIDEISRQARVPWSDLCL